MTIMHKGTPSASSGKTKSADDTKSHKRLSHAKERNGSESPERKLGQTEPDVRPRATLA